MGIPAPNRRLQELRAERDLTLEQVATATRLTRDTIARMEAGKGASHLRTKWRVARFYAVPVGELFPEESVSA